MKGRKEKAVWGKKKRNVRKIRGEKQKATENNQLSARRKAT